MKSYSYIFNNYINSIIFLISLFKQNPISKELKDSFYNYIKNIEETISSVELTKDDIKGKDILNFLFS